MRGLYASTRYIYMFLAEDGMDENIVSAAEGYSGSSQDHYYFSMGASEQASRLFRHKRARGCQSCLKLIPEYCLLLPGCNFYAGVTSPGAKLTICCARPSAEARHIQNARNPLPDFCMGLKLV